MIALVIALVCLVLLSVAAGLFVYFKTRTPPVAKPPPVAAAPPQTQNPVQRAPPPPARLPLAAPAPPPTTAPVAPAPLGDLRDDQIFNLMNGLTESEMEVFNIEENMDMLFAFAEARLGYPITATDLYLVRTRMEKRDELHLKTALEMDPSLSWEEATALMSERLGYPLTAADKYRLQVRIMYYMIDQMSDRGR